MIAVDLEPQRHVGNQDGAQEDADSTASGLLSSSLEARILTSKTCSSSNQRTVTCDGLNSTWSISNRNVSSPPCGIAWLESCSRLFVVLNRRADDLLSLAADPFQRSFRYLCFLPVLVEMCGDDEIHPLLGTHLQWAQDRELDILVDKLRFRKIRSLRCHRLSTSMIPVGSPSHSSTTSLRPPPTRTGCRMRSGASPGVGESDGGGGAGRGSTVSV